MNENDISYLIRGAAFKVHTLSVNDWLLVIGFALIPLMVNELIKVFMRIGKTKDAM